LLLLDDPAAAIDPHTEHEILGAIEQARAAAPPSSSPIA